jgi:hypothetical protein
MRKQDGLGECVSVPDFGAEGDSAVFDVPQAQGVGIVATGEADTVRRNLFNHHHNHNHNHQQPGATMNTEPEQTDNGQRTTDGRPNT